MNEVQKIDDKHYTVMCLRVDVPNDNKRLYPRAVVEKAIASLQETTKQRGLIGQLGMPGDSIIHWAQASHLITNLFVNEEGCLMAEIEVLDTPCGRVLTDLLNNETVAFRTQGIGDGKVNEDGVLILGESYKLISIHALPKDEAVSW